MAAQMSPDAISPNAITPVAPEKAVRAVESAYDLAWRQGDLEALLGCLADDVVLVNPRGESAHGIDEARHELSGFIATEGVDTTHDSEIHRVSFPTGDVAVVDGTATLRGPEGEQILVHSFTDVLVRGSGSWRIAHVRAYRYLR